MKKIILFLALTLSLASCTPEPISTTEVATLNSFKIDVVDSQTRQFNNGAWGDWGVIEVKSYEWNSNTTEFSVNFIDGESEKHKGFTQDGKILTWIVTGEGHTYKSIADFTDSDKVTVNKYLDDSCYEQMTSVVQTK